MNAHGTAAGRDDEITRSVDIIGVPLAVKEFGNRAVNPQAPSRFGVPQEICQGCLNVRRIVR